MKTLHVVGFKKSGKTTLLARWICLLKKEGLTVAVLKHHGHTEPLGMPELSTDSMQFFLSGAHRSVVAGAGVMQMLVNEEPDFVRIKEFLALGKPDILLIEGYKEERGDKVVLCRNTDDWEQLSVLKDIRLVVGADALESGKMHIKSRTDENQLDEWLLQWVGKEDGDETV